MRAEVVQIDGRQMIKAYPDGSVEFILLSFEHVEKLRQAMCEDSAGDSSSAQ